MSPRRKLATEGWRNGDDYNQTQVVFFRKETCESGKRKSGAAVGSAGIDFVAADADW